MSTMLSPVRKAARHISLLAQVRARNSSSSSSGFSGSSIHSLRAAFRDPTTPFHISPGTQGPASPNEPPLLHPSLDPTEDIYASAEKARRVLTEKGYDPTSFWEQQIVWGYHDAFQHVNNVHYVRFFESGRIKWMVSLANELGGPQKAQDMLQAKGVGLILKYIDVKYKRPVRFPDTLLIAHKPVLSPSPSSTHPSRTQFNVLATAYSYAQDAIVAESDSILVWYDYHPDVLRKCDPGDEAWRVLKGRIKE